MIDLSPRAAEEVRRILDEKGMSEDSALRLGVAGGGCSGFEYVLDFTDAVGEEDAVFEQHGIRVVVDTKSQAYLEGLQIDFNESLLNRGFKFSNPNASGTCGCGTSFSV